MATRVEIARPALVGVKRLIDMVVSSKVWVFRPYRGVWISANISVEIPAMIPYGRFGLLALLSFAALFANPMSSAAAQDGDAVLPGQCPAGYQAKPGLNVDFPID